MSECSCDSPPESELCACGGVICDTCGKCENEPNSIGCEDCEG